MNSSVTQPVRSPRKWTPEEDQKLRVEVSAQLMEGEAKDWCRIAAKLPGRTNKDCRKRWHNSVAGGLKKGQWSSIEDRQLARGVEQYGRRWTLVADVVHSRSADQCAKRWQQSLDPDLDRSEWRDWEDKLLLDAMKIHGRRWKDIQHHHFPGRSKNCIKNRYTVLARKHLNQGTELSKSRSTPKTEIPHLSNAVSKPPSVHDDLSLPGSQVSTPDFSDFYSAEDDMPVSFWDTPPPITMGLGTSINEYSNPIHQRPTSNVSQQDQWDWTSMPMSRPICTETSSSDSFTNFQQNTPYMRYDDLYTDSMISSPSLSHHHEAWNELLPTSSPSAVPAGSMYPDLQGMFQCATDQSQQAQHNHFYSPLLEVPHNDRQNSRGQSFLLPRHS